MLKSFCLMHMPDVQMHDDLVMDHKTTRPDCGPRTTGDRGAWGPENHGTKGRNDHRDWATLKCFKCP